jgi:hypothetical protein
MRKEEQWTREQLQSVRTNILWLVFYVAILVVLCFDMLYWRPG